MLFVEVAWIDYGDTHSRLIRNVRKNTDPEHPCGLEASDIMAEVGFSCLVDEKKTRLDNIKGSFVVYGKNNCFETIGQAKKFAQEEMGVENSGIVGQDQI